MCNIIIWYNQIYKQNEIFQDILFRFLLRSIHCNLKIEKKIFLLVGDKNENMPSFIDNVEPLFYEGYNNIENAKTNEGLNGFLSEKFNNYTLIQLGTIFLTPIYNMDELSNGYLFPIDPNVKFTTNICQNSHIGIIINNKKEVNDIIKIQTINEHLNLHFPTTSIYEKKIKSAVCVICKDEENYIEEWVENYRKIGFDNIILYDNSDIGKSSLKESVCKYIDSKFVIYHDWRGKRDLQQNRAYQDCYYRYKNNYDWISFFDADEFLYLVKHKNIQDFLYSNFMFNKYKIIHFSWQIYDDNGMIDYDTMPLQKRFTKLSEKAFHVSKHQYSFAENQIVKSIIKTDLEDIKWVENDKPIKYALHAPGINFIDYAVNPSGVVVPNTYSHAWDYNIAYLKHYRTKTVGEYLNKFKRGEPILHQIHDVSKMYHYKLLNRFFETNELTKEKRDIFAKLFPNVFLDEEWDNIIKESYEITESKIDLVINFTGNETLLKYKLRGIEKNTPWVNKIHLILPSNVITPEYIDINKVNIVKYKDFIPKCFLPSENYLTAEIFLCNIKGLSNNFIYGNENTIFTNYLTPCNFFYNEKPVYILDMRPNNGLNKEICFNTTKMLNMSFLSDSAIIENRTIPMKKESCINLFKKNIRRMLKHISQTISSKNISLSIMALLYDNENSIPNIYKHKKVKNANMITTDKKIKEIYIPKTVMKKYKQDVINKLEKIYSTKSQYEI